MIEQRYKLPDVKDYRGNIPVLRVCVPAREIVVPVAPDLGSRVLKEVFEAKEREWD